MINTVIVDGGIGGSGGHGLSNLGGDVIGESTIHLGILSCDFSLIVLFIQQISFGLQESTESLVPNMYFLG